MQKILQKFNGFFLVVDNIIIKDGEEEDVGDLGITC
jgi:hypothetical protein